VRRPAMGLFPRFDGRQHIPCAFNHKDRRKLWWHSRQSMGGTGARVKAPAGGRPVWKPRSRIGGTDARFCRTLRDPMPTPRRVRHPVAARGKDLAPAAQAWERPQDAMRRDRRRDGPEAWRPPTVRSGPVHRAAPPGTAQGRNPHPCGCSPTTPAAMLPASAPLPAPGARVRQRTSGCRPPAGPGGLW